MSDHALFGNFQCAAVAKIVDSAPGTAAEQRIRAIGKMVNDGREVYCSIHTTSPEIFVIYYHYMAGNGDGS